MNNNYLRYYQSRASSIEPSQIPLPITQTTSILSHNHLGSGPLHSSRYIRSQSQQPQSEIFSEQSPRIITRDVYVSQPQSITASSFNLGGEKNMQQFALEKQNECLRKEIDEMENQIQKLKIFYTRQSSLEQQELARYEKEKSSLVDKLREMDDSQTLLKDTHATEMAFEKQASRKQRVELENKLEKLSQHYSEQIAKKQDELHNTKNQLQLSEINISDLTAKLRIFEQTNKDLRSKWDADIKNFGNELENLNRQLLKERYRNDELERLQKLNRASLQQQEESNLMEKEVDILRQSNAEQRLRIYELEKLLKTDSLLSSDVRGSINSGIRERLNQKQTELDRIQLEYSKKSSEVEILAKQIDQLQVRIATLNHNISDKDILVAQMFAHIETIEKENQALIKRSPLQQFSSQPSQSKEIQYLSEELSILTAKNRELENQLARNPQKYHLLAAKIEAIQIQFTHLSNGISDQAQMKMFLNEINNLSAEIVNAKYEVDQIIIEDTQPQDIGERLETGDFSPQRPDDIHNQTMGSGLLSEFKKVTIPERLIKTNQFQNTNAIPGITTTNSDTCLGNPLADNQQQQHLINAQDGENSSQQTFGDTRRNSLEQIDQLDQFEAKPMKQKDRIEKLLGSAASAISLTASSIPLPHHSALLANTDKVLELDIGVILPQSQQQHQPFQRIFEGSSIFDLVVAFIGSPGSGKSTVIQSVIKEEWNKSVPEKSCSGMLQISRYGCMGKSVALMESSPIAEPNMRRFICNVAQAIVLHFKSWDNNDKSIFIDYVKLLQAEMKFASELIVIHAKSEQLSNSDLAAITADLTKLQDGLYRGKIEGKLKKINVYHIFLHDHNNQTKSKSIFEETIAVCRGTIIGKLSSNIEKTDLFKKLNSFTQSSQS